MAPSRHDWKIVDWDVKPQHKQTNTLDFMNFTPKIVADNCLQTHVSNTGCPKGQNFKLMADVFLIKF